VRKATMLSPHVFGITKKNYVRNTVAIHSVLKKKISKLIFNQLNIKKIKSKKKLWKENQKRKKNTVVIHSKM